MRTRVLFASFVFAVVAPGVAAADQNIWMGTAPFCKATPDDCRQAGMVYVRSDRRGDGSKCVSGTKVLCHRAATGGEFGYDHPHEIDGQPLREIRPTTSFSITEKASRCE
ncbi:MAG TPA: hypothetical protein VFT22_04030 [Kofleriaceae bacterium]|nr:hypothetical protein [Kofleriaceae bacterium]